MSLAVTVALSLVIIAVGVAIPGLMVASSHILAGFLPWVLLLCVWLVDVFFWVLLQFHLYELRPEYFQDPGPWDAINGWPAFFALAMIVYSFAVTVDSN